MQREPNRGGRLKIFFSYAPGAGKTEAMLAAAAREKQRGTDVAAGWLNQMADGKSMQLPAGIECLPARRIRYGDRQCREFDLDAALQRAPRLILVEDMAHRNRAGSRHRRRYQEIEELLRAGIDVYTTANVQNLESLGDLIFSVTGNTEKERVPDAMFDGAAQIEFVDMEPEQMLSRWRERDWKAAECPPPSVEVLIALREIALRRMADYVGRKTGKKRKGAQEHLLICLSGAPSNAAVIRAAARMAEAFHGKLTALYVESRQAKSEEVRENLRLARKLGACIATVYGEDTALQIAEYAQLSGVTKIVLGRSARWGGARQMVDRLGKLAPGVDIYIIPDRHSCNPRVPFCVGAAKESVSADRKEKKWRMRPQRENMMLRDLLGSLGIMAVCTAVNFLLLRMGIELSNIELIYVLGVLCVAATTGGKLSSLTVSLLAVLMFNFFFVEPYFTLTSAPKYAVTFLIMFAAAMMSSMMTRRVKNQAVLSARNAYRTGTLLETSRKLQEAQNEKEILSVAAEQLGKLLGRTVVIYPAAEGERLGQPRIYPEGKADDRELSEKKDAGQWCEELRKEREVAQWVFANNKHAGAMTQTFSDACCLYLAVRSREQALAVAGVYLKDSEPPGDFEKELLVAILDECGLALEREKIRKDNQELEQTARQEALRANLLRAISHDLRTPLTSIFGNARLLMEGSQKLEEKKKQSLYLAIYDDAAWLTGLVENLLSITRIENSRLRLSLKASVLEEVFYEALDHLDRRASEHEIVTRFPEEILVADMDARLIMQVVVNIVNNAVKYTQPGSRIEIAACRDGNFVRVNISDNGPGIPAEDRKRIFDMFYTAENDNADGRPGLGLGLALCRSIVNAHGGTIGVEGCEPHGTCFSFTLRASEVAAYE